MRRYEFGSINLCAETFAGVEEGEGEVRKYAAYIIARKVVGIGEKRR